MLSNLHGKYFFFDLETNGLRGEILQFGWIIADCNATGAKVIATHEHIVKQPRTFKLNPGGEKVHHISSARIEKEGVLDTEESLLKFIKTAESCSYLAGYNIKSFDLTQIYRHCKKLKKLSYFNKNYVETRWKLCDMLYVAKDFLKQKQNYTGTCRLDVSYPLIVPNARTMDPTKSHNALYDTRATLDIFEAIYKNPNGCNIIYNRMNPSQRQSKKEVKQLKELKDSKDSKNSKDTRDLKQCKQSNQSKHPKQSKLPKNLKKPIKTKKTKLRTSPKATGHELLDRHVAHASDASHERKEPTTPPVIPKIEAEPVVDDEKFEIMIEKDAPPAPLQQAEAQQEAHVFEKDAKELLQWSQADVMDWVRNLFGSDSIFGYERNFMDAKITGADLVFLTQNTLKSVVGISDPNHAELIICAIDGLRDDLFVRRGIRSTAASVKSCGKIDVILDEMEQNPRVGTCKSAMVATKVAGGEKGMQRCFLGAKFVLWCQFESLSKDECVDLINKYGGCVHKQVCDDTHYALVGTGMDEKKLAVVRAAYPKLELLDESRFREMLRELSRNMDETSDMARKERNELICSVCGKPAEENRMCTDCALACCAEFDF